MAFSRVRLASKSSLKSSISNQDPRGQRVKISHIQYRDGERLRNTGKEQVRAVRRSSLGRASQHRPQRNRLQYREDLTYLAPVCNIKRSGLIPAISRAAVKFESNFAVHCGSVYRAACQSGENGQLVSVLSHRISELERSLIGEAGYMASALDQRASPSLGGTCNKN
jgi:hypothetical protein